MKNFTLKSLLISFKKVKWKKLISIEFINFHLVKDVIMIFMSIDNVFQH